MTLALTLSLTLAHLICLTTTNQFPTSEYYQTAH